MYKFLFITDPKLKYSGANIKPVEEKSEESREASDQSH